MNETRTLAAILVADFLGHCRHAAAGSSSKLLKGGWRTEISSPTRGDFKVGSPPDDSRLSGGRGPANFLAMQKSRLMQRGHGRL
jgi:hypothetical protein